MADDVLDASMIDGIEGEFSDYLDDLNPPIGEDSGGESNLDNGDSNNPPIEEHNETDLTTDLLRLIGISDPHKIKFEDESGATIEKDWDSLSRNEQLNILTDHSNPDTDLDESEIELINAIRQSQLSPQDYIAQLKQNAMLNALDSTPQPYKIDELADDELYAIKIMRDMGIQDFSQESDPEALREVIQERIDQAQKNPDLYQREIAALRAQYKELEDRLLYDQQQQEFSEREAQYQSFTHNILNEIEGLDSLGGVEMNLTTDDMNELANFILTRDETGTTDFAKVLNSPKEFTTAALWYLRGDQIMADMLNEIQEAYKRGFNDGKQNSTTNNGGRVTVQKQNDPPKLTKWDIFGTPLDEGSYLN